MSDRPSQATSAQKRRGRPQKEPAPEDESLKLRRERNRQAQHVFRVRKQAAQLEQEQQIQKLEETIEQMSSVFLGFADDILQSEKITKDSDLMHKLREAIQRTVTLARSEPSSSGMQHASGEPSGSAQIQDRESTAESQDSGAHAMDVDMPFAHNTPVSGESSEPSPLVDLVDDNFVSMEEVIHSDSQSTAMIQAPNNTPFANTSTLGDISFSASIFGNGWTSDLPFSYTSALHKQPVAGRTLSLKIIQCTLQTAYYCLTDAAQLSGTLGQQIFQFSLRQHTQEEIAFNIRWFLGPGNTEIFRLSDVDYGKVLPKEMTATLTLHPFVDLYAIDEAAAKTKSVSVNPFKPFVNADEVEGYLKARGARYVDEDILEISLGDDLNKEATVAQSTDNSPKPQSFTPQRGFLNSEVFFPVTQMQDTGLGQFISPAQLEKRTLRISQWLLMRHLSEISVCLAYGPAYLREDLEKAIADSIVG